MKTAVIYARYSCENQTEQSIEGQLRVCQEYAKRNDIIIVDTYIDRAMSGTNDNRVDFQRMLKESDNRQWDYVVVYKLDRFSRNKYEMAMHKKTLRDNGVKILSAMENIPDTPEGIILESLLEGMAEYYSAELAQKVNRGIRESWLKGNSTGGRAIYGYDVIDKKFVINKYEAAVIEDIFTKYSQGYTIRVINKSLNERGIRRKDGSPFKTMHVSHILHNKRYTGVVEHYGVLYDNIYPQIISKELWYAVNTINEENKIGPSRKKEIYDYILSGKLVCGECKHRMSGESGTSRNGKIHYYYMCLSKRKRKAKCNTQALTKQYLEDVVIDATAAMLDTPENIHLIAKSILEVHQKEEADNTTLKLLEKNRSEAVKASNNLIKAIEQGIITEMTKTRLRQLENEIAQYDFDIDREKQRTYSYLSLEKIEEFLRSKVFDEPQDIKIRKLLVNTFVREVILYPDKIIITYNFTEMPEPHKINEETIEETEGQISSALNEKGCSYTTRQGEPYRGNNFAP